MPTGNLRTRIEKLEGRAATPASVCSFDVKLALLAAKISTPIEEIQAVIANHRLAEYLDREIDDSGLITWDGFCALRTSLINDLGRGADIYVAMPPAPAAPNPAEVRRYR